MIRSWQLWIWHVQQLFQRSYTSSWTRFHFTTCTNCVHLNTLNNLSYSWNFGCKFNVGFGYSYSVTSKSVSREFECLQNGHCIIFWGKYCIWFDCGFNCVRHSNAKILEYKCKLSKPRCVVLFRIVTSTSQVHFTNEKSTVDIHMCNSSNLHEGCT